MSSANSFAYFIIYLWPLVTIYLLSSKGIKKGAFLALLWAFMFLPAYFTIDFPGIPPLDKFSITSLTIIVFTVLSGRNLGISHLSKLCKLVVFGFVFSPLATVLFNGHPYLHINSLSFHDGIAMVINNVIYVVPFLIGAKYFDSYQDQVFIFKSLAMAVVIYSILALYEVRMSPQLHNIFYGFFPHDWLQQIRGGGFRAIVFMGHGLLVSMFIVVGLGVWISLNKNKIRVFKINVSNNWVIFFVFVALVFMKSLAALIYGLFLIFAINFLATKKMHLISVALTVVFITYPLTSSLNVFPHQSLVEMAYSFNPERGQSLEYRFDNEETLLSHALEKPFFGWGGWGRNRVYDPKTGEDITVADGKWVLTIGIRGWIGFLAEYLMMILPIWVAYRAHRSMMYESKDSKLLAVHSLITAIILIDQMPNASITPFYLLLSGALLARANSIIKTQKTMPNIRAA
jgi:hypothetical protein